MEDLDRDYRDQWLKKKIEEIKAGGDMETVCTMGTPERLRLGLCDGAIPVKRMERGYHTCSLACQNDYNRLRRWQDSKGECRLCGRGLSKTAKKELEEKRAKREAPCNPTLDSSTQTILAPTGQVNLTSQTDLASADAEANTPSST